MLISSNQLIIIIKQSEGMENDRDISGGAFLRRLGREGISLLR